MPMHCRLQTGNERSEGEEKIESKVINLNNKDKLLFPRKGERERNLLNNNHEKIFTPVSLRVNANARELNSTHSYLSFFPFFQHYLSIKWIANERESEREGISEEMGDSLCILPLLLCNFARKGKQQHYELF